MTHWKKEIIKLKDKNGTMTTNREEGQNCTRADKTLMSNIQKT